MTDEERVQFDALGARVEEAEAQVRHEFEKKVELAVLVGKFIKEAAPLAAAAGVSLDLEEVNL